MTAATVATGPLALRSDTAGQIRRANRLAAEISGRSYISYSQLALMRACPKSFSFRYVEKARPDFISSSLLVGTGIHVALDLFFRAKLEGLAVSREALLSAFHDAWTNQQTRSSEPVPIRFNKGQTPDTLHALADRILTAFLASPLARPKGTILGVEEELRVVLDPDLPDVLAVVDLVTQTDSLNLVDWKTARSRWTPEKAVESGDQLVLYGFALSEMSRSLHLPVKLHFGIITKTKVPAIQILPVPTDASRVQVMTESFAAVWSAIRAGNYYPAPNPMNCSTCPFRSRCPVFKGQ